MSEEAVICPHCAHNCLTPQLPPYLPKGAYLTERYTVGKLLSASADKATYIGFDNTENKPVKIREFLPVNLIIRELDQESVTVRVGKEQFYEDCMQSFETLWKSLINLNSAPAFDDVYEVFFLNNTVYAVCEYSEGVSLKSYFESREKLLSWQKAVAAFKPLMYVLSQLHTMGIIHGDISPESITVGADGKLRLDSVNINQTHISQSEIEEKTVGGYAPIERCKDYSILSPATDIYSLMAVMYTAVTGLVPPPAAARVSGDTLMLPVKIEQRMPPLAAEAFYSAIQVFPSARTNDVELLIKALSEAEKEAVQNTNQAEEPAGASPKADTVTPKTAEPKASEQKIIVPKDSSSTAEIFLKSFITAVIVIVLVFVTLYSTVLYEYMSIPALDNMLSVASFLPINIDRETTEPEEETRTPETAPTETKYVTVADFKTLRYHDIKQNAVFNTNFDMVYIFEYSDEYEENAVISQSIPYGQSVPYGTTVELIISKGVEPVVLKDVIGLQFDDAKAVLEHDGFTVTKKLLENDGLQNAGEVFTMSHVAGLEFDKGTEITLSVWDEIKPEESENETEKDNSSEGEKETSKKSER